MNSSKYKDSGVEEELQTMKGLIYEIYQEHSAEELNIVWSQLLQILDENCVIENSKCISAQPLWDQSSVVLIAYPDCVYRDKEPTLQTFLELIEKKIGGLVSIIHVLPFLTSTSDGGFAVSSHEVLENRFGEWKHLKDLSFNHILMADLVLNHVSSSHEWVQQFIKSISPGNEYILAPSSKDGWDKVIRPRSSSLFTNLSTNKGPVDVWTTFGPDQVDVNWHNPYILIEFIKLIVRYIDHGVFWIRLDAVAFIWKEENSSCLHRAQVHKIVKLLRMLLSTLCKSSVIITETNVPEKENLSYLNSGDEAHIAYNFTLPPLLLESLISSKADLLNEWLFKWPSLPDKTSFLNFTSSHDGIGLRALEGLMDSNRIHNLLFNCEKRGGLVSHRKLENGEEKPYELNISWWSAMSDSGRDQSLWQIQRFMLSQLFTLALKGIPALYLQAILASENDIRTFSSSGQRRDLNRERFQADTLLLKLNDPNSFPSKIIKELKTAIHLRKQLQCFHPSAPMKCLSRGRSDIVIFSRGEGEDMLWAVHNMTNNKLSLSLSKNLSIPDNNELHLWKDYLSNQTFFDNRIDLQPYSVIWLTRVQP